MQKTNDTTVLPPVLLNGQKFKSDDRIAVNAKGYAVKLEDQPPDTKYS